jgi:hypothetical protein
LSVDPLVDLTEEPYAYTGGDPVNEVDPLGLHGCGWTDPFGCVANAAGDIASAVSHHWRGITTAAGIAAGLAAAATGVGAIVEGSAALGFTSATLGVASGLADLPACIGTGGKHDVGACIGSGAGVLAGGLSGAGAFLDAETAELEALGYPIPTWRFIVSGLAWSKAFAGGIAATFWDLFNAANSLISVEKSMCSRSLAFRS